MKSQLNRRDLLGLAGAALTGASISGLWHLWDLHSKSKQEAQLEKQAALEISQQHLNYLGYDAKQAASSLIAEHNSGSSPVNIDLVFGRLRTMLHLLGEPQFAELQKLDGFSANSRAWCSAGRRRAAEISALALTTELTGSLGELSRAFTAISESAYTGSQKPYNPEKLAVATLCVAYQVVAVGERVFEVSSSSDTRPGGVFFSTGPGAPKFTFADGAKPAYQACQEMLPNLKATLEQLSGASSTVRRGESYPPNPASSAARLPRI